MNGGIYTLVRMWVLLGLGVFCLLYSILAGKPAYFGVGMTLVGLEPVIRAKKNGKKNDA